jgi:hypothetical protein
VNTEKTVREQLRFLLRGGNAHMRFDEAVDRFPLEQINTYPPGIPYTPWRLLEHIRIAQWDILEFIRNPHHVSPPWPEGYWPPETARAELQKWEQTIADFHADHRALEAIVADPDIDLFAPLPHAKDYTLLREILVVCDHNAYHLGEFALLRQVLNAWTVDRSS